MHGSGDFVDVHVIIVEKAITIDLLGWGLLGSKGPGGQYQFANARQHRVCPAPLHPDSASSITNFW